MGEQLYAVVYRKRIKKILKNGKRGKDKWVRGYRAPQPEDDNSAEIRARLAEKLPEWEALDIVPSEKVPDGNKTKEPLRYGMRLWRDMFSPRQLLCHGTSVEVFREMLESDETENNLSDLRRAAYGYLAITLDTLLDYNNRLALWDMSTGRVRHLFKRHDFAFVWSYAEMAPLISGMGYDWALGKTTKCIHELVSLGRPEGGAETGNLLTYNVADNRASVPVAITCRSGDNLDHIVDGSVDAIVIDPPYYDNVMYAELSDFFYVWLKRTAGHVFPDLFRLQLTDKENEAVANRARIREPQGVDETAGSGRSGRGRQSVKALSGKEYQERMARIFSECRRVLQPSGIMTLMFMHKSTGAWDALARGLIEAGFVITASWPINTEAEGSLHIKDKAAANSTTFLACRLRGNDRARPSDIYWEDVEPEVAKAVTERVAGFQAAGIRGVDLYLAAFGPALEVLSRHWPLRRGTPRPRPQQRGRRSVGLPVDTVDPYATTPEDALDVARREVKRWRLEELTQRRADADLDGLTAFFVLAWDAFRAPMFAYDEALSLGRAVGVDLERDVIGRLAAKSGSDIRLLDSTARAAKPSSLGPVDGSRGMIDVLHRAAHIARTRTVDDARELLTDAGVDREQRFLDAFRAVLEVLPPSVKFTGEKLEKHVASAGDDFEALYNLYRHAFTDVLEKPKQLELFEDGAGS